MKPTTTAIIPIPVSLVGSDQSNEAVQWVLLEDEERNIDPTPVGTAAKIIRPQPRCSGQDRILYREGKRHRFSSTRSGISGLYQMYTDVHSARH